MNIFSGGAGREQQCPGRLCDSRGAAGQGEAREVVSAEEDQTRGHDNTVTTGLVLEYLRRENTYKSYTSCKNNLVFSSVIQSLFSVKKNQKYWWKINKNQNLRQ